MNKVLEVCPVKLASFLENGQVDTQLRGMYMKFTFHFDTFEDKKQAEWAVDYFASLCAEYTRRFGIIHEYEQFISHFDRQVKSKYGNLRLVDIGDKLC